MAGVAGPMRRRDRAGSLRFLAGLAVGGATGGLLLAVPVYLAGALLAGWVPLPVRLAVLAAVAAGFAVADLRNRTPHIWRQVPQRLVRTLSPGTLGLVWGVDLGLLFTTQKTVSLLWVSIAGLALVAPAAAPTALAAFAVVAATAVTLWSFTPWVLALGRRQDREWVRQARWVSAAALLVVGVVTATLAVTTAT